MSGETKQLSQRPNFHLPFNRQNPPAALAYLCLAAQVNHLQDLTLLLVPDARSGAVPAWCDGVCEERVGQLTHTRTRGAHAVTEQSFAAAPAGTVPLRIQPTLPSAASESHHAAWQLPLPTSL